MTVKKMYYEIADPSHVYPGVTVFAENSTKAKERALSIMMGCPLDDVDKKVVEESLVALVVVQQ